jgi:hypothetical protein
MFQPTHLHILAGAGHAREGADASTAHSSRDLLAGQADAGDHGGQLRVQSALLLLLWMEGR